MGKNQFIHLIKTALQAAKELGANVDPDKFKAFVDESNSMAGTVRPFDREVDQQLAALNDYAKRFGKLKPAKPSRSSGNQQFF
jgi:hypothetical protein